MWCLHHTHAQCTPPRAVYSPCAVYHPARMVWVLIALIHVPCFNNSTLDSTSPKTHIQKSTRAYVLAVNHLATKRTCAKCLLFTLFDMVTHFEFKWVGFNTGLSS